MSALRFERWYSHPPERVWHALTDRDQLARWLMPNDFEPRLGHRFTFRTQPGPGFDGIVHCEVLELKPRQRLVFTWRGGPIDTVLSFEMVAENGGTRLYVEQAGFRGVKAWLVSRILKAGLPTLYGKRLPAVLAELEGSSNPNASSPAAASCMKPRQRFVSHLLTWMQGDNKERR